MSDELRKRLQKGVRRLRGLKRTQKKNLILGSIILMLSMGLFFYAFLDQSAYAEKKSAKAKPVASEVLDPLNRIGKGMFNPDKCEKTSLLCRNLKKETISNFDNRGIKEMVQGRPMEQMVPYLSRKDKKVATFLVAIAKKESDWGLYSPKKGGRDCYNYWGYKGVYNLTESGYSCFDSPEQAVDVVGGRIENLVSKKIDTASKMVVWKCGSSCKSHDPYSVQKWISDVDSYYRRLN